MNIIIGTSNYPITHLSNYSKRGVKMIFKTISPVRLYESVTEQIMDLIKSRELKPGDKLPPERELAEKFSISRGSLREAFRVLESRGLIKSTPGGGRFIREINKDTFIDTENVILNLEKSSILELLEAREMFEVKIVELAAKRATEEDIKILEEIFKRVTEENGEKGREREDEEKTELDTEFHLAIARASHNFVFINIMRLHFDLLKDTREKTWQIPGRKEEQEEEHRAIFEAMKEHNPQKAANAMLNHLRNIREVVTEI
jgi:GntR family transcriptional regulator, transcriptional repressor for pyruvate dehydrogenase complex